MTRIVYTATPHAVGYGHLADATEVRRHAATLLVRPGVDREKLAASLSALATFIEHDEDVSARSGGHQAALAPANHDGALAISWDPSFSPGAGGERAFSQAWSTAVQLTKRAGPWFYGERGACVALVVDADLDRATVGAALSELQAYAVGGGSDFLEPLPVKRTVHHQGEIQGYTHDGMPVLGAGSMSSD